MCDLTEFATHDFDKLMANANPALRSAVERRLAGGTASAAFKSFIDVK
ncbi:hypothetical protein ACFROC_00900 [Nocardia tengchongensis]